MKYTCEEIKNKVNAVYDEVIALRRHLHMHPELSEQEYETSAFICEQLDKMNISYEKDIAGCGISAVIYGKDKTKGVALRADIDALPIEEKVKIPFKSKNPNIMHACGHDIHTAILLGAAKILNDMKENLPASVRLLFQPSEETIGGANQMIEAGCLKEPAISAVLGLHVDSGTDAGSVEFIPGSMNAACSEFVVTVKGKSCHGAHPNDGIDALLPACTMVSSLQSIITRRIDPAESVLITVGKFNSGTKENIVSGEAVFSGTMRALDMKNMDKLRNYLKELCEGIAASYGASCEISFSGSYPTLENDPQLFDWVKGTAEEVLGKDKVKLTVKPSLGADDFAFFCHESRGLYYNIGVRKPGDTFAHPIHSEFFNPDEECIRTGMLVQVASVLKILEEEA